MKMGCGHGKADQISERSTLNTALFLVKTSNRCAENKEDPQWAC